MRRRGCREDLRVRKPAGKVSESLPIKAYIHGKMYEVKSDICFFVAMRPKKSSGGETLLQKSRCLFVFSQKKCVLKNKITCRETSLTGTGTAQLPEKVRRNPEQMREGDPKKRRSYERKFKQISGTAAVGVHDHELPAY